MRFAAFFTATLLAGTVSADEPQQEPVELWHLDPDPPVLDFGVPQDGAWGQGPAWGEPHMDPHARIAEDYYPDFYRGFLAAAFLGLGSMTAFVGTPFLIAGSVWAHDQNSEDALDWRPVTVATVGTALVAAGATMLTIGIVLATRDDEKEAVVLQANPGGVDLVVAF